MNQLPPYMHRRHEALNKIYAMLLSKEESIQSLFDFENSIHADLELSWIKPDFQEKHIGSTKEFQIVLARVKPGQTSDAHMHEIGASSFIVLGPKVGMPEPKDLIYRTGAFDFQTREATITKEITLEEGMELDIPSHQVHQFENKNIEPAYTLIVTHPIISVEKGHEDIHFVWKK